MPDSVNINFRVPKDERTTFEAACKAKDLSMSQVLRKCMREFTKENRQGDMFKVIKK